MTLTLPGPVESKGLVTEEHEIPAQPSLREVFDAHAPFVWRTLRYLGVGEADLEDVCQEVFLVVHQKLSTFEGRSSLETWIYGICIRTASSHRKRAYVRREVPVSETPDATVEPRQVADLEEQRARELLSRALDALDDEKRQVFVLFEIEERPMQEIANVVGCPLRTAYSRLHAAREEMAKTWERLSKEGRPR
jgi:RNA polymerase sigma-70 factor (ECF subfamily)